MSEIPNLIVRIDYEKPIELKVLGKAFYALSKEFSQYIKNNSEEKYSDLNAVLYVERIREECMEIILQIIIENMSNIINAAGSIGHIILMIENFIKHVEECAYGEKQSSREMKDILKVIIEQSRHSKIKLTFGKAKLEIGYDLVKRFSIRRRKRK